MSAGSTVVPARILTGTVWHERRSPRRHRFGYRMWWADLDLDALDQTLDSLRALGTHRGRPLRFDRRDYLEPHDIALADAVRDLVADRLGHRPAGAIRLLAHLRTLGWCFNPIVVYLCHDADGELDSVVCDVTNTPWKERHQYVFAAGPGGVRDHVEPKALHVSPFMPMDQRYRFTLHDDPDRFVLRIDTLDDTGVPFAAGVDLAARPMTDTALANAMVRHPLLTLRVSLGIHTQAARLLRRRIPVHPHPRRHRPAQPLVPR